MNPGELPYPDSTPERSCPTLGFPSVLTHGLAGAGMRVHVETGPAFTLVAAFKVDAELAAGVWLLALVNICV